MVEMISALLCASAVASIVVGENDSPELLNDYPSPDGVDRYEGDNGSLGFGFDSNAIAANQVLDLRSAQDLKAALPSAPLIHY